MAEYYPLLTRALSNLGSTTPETRQAIYARARKALEAQLGHLTPPDPELVERETHALEAAITKLEDEMKAEQAKADAEKAAKAKEAEAEAAKLPSTPLSADGHVPPPLATAPPPRGFTLPPAERAAEDEAKAQQAEDLSGLIAKLKDVSRSPLGASSQQLPSSSKSEAVESGVASRPDDITTEAAPAIELDEDAEMLRPAAVPAFDVPVARERGFIFAIVIGVIVFAVAIAAYMLRDRPEDMAKLRAAANAEHSDQPAAGKLSERVTDAAPQNAPQSQTQAVVDTAPVEQNQKAVLILEAPGVENGSKRFEGNVSWRLDGINRGPSQEIIPDVRGDIDFPELKLRVSLVIYKNMDPALPASHIIQLKFDPAADSAFVGVAQTDMIAMRQDDNAPPEYLQGIPTPVMTNYILYALTQNERAVSTNLDTLRTRSQFDVLMMMTNNLRARIAFEKGAAGAKVFEQASDVLK